LRSGDSDRVNTVDEIKELSVIERADLFDTCFEDVTDMYVNHYDGYVRQSCVRVVEQLAPKIWSRRKVL